MSFPKYARFGTAAVFADTFPARWVGPAAQLDARAGLA